VVTLHSHTVDGVLDDVRTVGDAVERPDDATDIVDDLRARLDAVRERTAGFDRKDVVVLDWLEPPMVAGHWGPELVHVAGGDYPLASPGDVSTVRDWDEVRDAAPEVLIAAPCGFDLHQTVENFDEVAEREGWDELPAVREGRVYAADGDGYFNRPGPRLVETAEALACCLHPDEFGPPPSDVAATPVRVR
ncbi:MAG: ABC transporter substrate-binding protein, partial [Halobacteria archaeon]